MQQIADELGLSRVTVSSVINGRDAQRGISPSTAQLVRQHVARRGYVPNRQAVSLRQGATGTVGVLYGGGLFSHLTEAFNRIVDTLSGGADPVELMIVRRGELLRGVRELVARGVGRLVWIVSRAELATELDPDVLHYLSNLDVVVYNFPFGNRGLEAQLLEQRFHLVGVDRGAGFDAVAHFLKKLGHRRVALPEVHDLEQEHFRCRAFTDAGLLPVATLPGGLAIDDPAQLTEPMTEGLLEAVRNRRVTAACFYDDLVAGRVSGRLVARGVDIPRDLTVTGFDGMPYAEAFNPPLTTLSIPVDRMVRRVCDILDNTDRRQHRHRFKLELVERESHGRAPRGEA